MSKHPRLGRFLSEKRDPLLYFRTCSRRYNIDLICLPVKGTYNGHLHHLTFSVFSFLFKSREVLTPPYYNLIGSFKMIYAFLY